MASQGPNFPTNAQSVDLGAAQEPWVNPTNVVSDNGSEAQITAATYDAGDQSDRLLIDTFGFTVPDTATIDGVELGIERRAFAGAATDFRVQLYSHIAGNVIGNNLRDNVTAWPGTASVVTYGSPTTVWGSTLTPGFVNSGNFGAVLEASATAANTDIGVDHMKMIIYYTDGGGGGGVVDPGYYRRMVQGYHHL